MKIRFIGQRNNLGGGTHYSNFVDAALKTYYINASIEEVNLSDPSSVQEALNTSADGDINIWFWQNPSMSAFKGVNIRWAIFESDKLPQYALESLAPAHLIWVPSQWGKDVLIANGVDAQKIDVVPEGVDTNLFHPFLRSKTKKENTAFRFLCIGKYEKRKSYAELLEGFKRAFANSSEVELVIKGDYFIRFEQKKQELIDLVSASGLTNVKLAFGNYPKEKLVALYNIGDVFIFPSKGEGWGLPLLEAAATGMPLISTVYSGHTQFLRYLSSSLLPIDFALQPIDDPEFMGYWPAEDKNYGLWAQPDVDSIAKSMQEMKSNYEHFSAEAIKNSLVMREKFSWDSAWWQAMNSLKTREYLAVDYSVGEK